MNKIPCLFERDFTDKRRPVLLRSVSRGCEWVLAGEGLPTRKRDGTACMVRAGRLWRRHDVRRGRPVPAGAVPCCAQDPVTGHWPHWVEVGDGPEDKWHREAWTGLRASDGTRFRDKRTLEDGTYELCGPKIQGNSEKLDEHVLIRHGEEVLAPLLDAPRTWDYFREYLYEVDIEGIVWHGRGEHAGSMAKLRRDDYGFAWPVKDGGA